MLIMLCTLAGAGALVLRARRSYPRDVAIAASHERHGGPSQGSFATQGAGKA
jgi:hypothetical protein